MTGAEDQHTRELETLAEANRLLTSTLDLGEILDRLAAIAQRRLAVDVVRIWLLDDSGETLSLRAQRGATEPGVPVSSRVGLFRSLSGWVVNERAPLILPDAQEDPRLMNREWFRAAGLVSFLGMPLMLDDRAIGVLACMARARREFSDGDVALAQALTGPAVAAARNASLYAEALARLEEIEAFQRVSAETLSSPDSETALRVVVREMQHLLGSDAAVCSLIDVGTGRLRTVSSRGARGSGIRGYSPGGGGGAASIVVRERRAMRSEDYLADPRFARTPDIEAWARLEGVVTLIAAPVLDPGGEVIALLWAFNRTARPFTARHEATASALAQQAALAIGKARAFEDERRRAEQTSALLDIARASTSTLEFGPLLGEMARRSALALGAHRSAIFLWRDGRLAPVAAQFADGHIDPELWTGFRDMLRDQRVEDLPGHAEAIRSRRPVPVTREGGLLPEEWFERLGVRAALIVPLVSDRKSTRLNSSH